MPEVYDRCLGPALFAPFATHLAGIAAALAPGRVLELAAGTGIATSALLKALPGAQVVATDLNPAMVDWAATNVPEATWRQADAQHVPFPDESFDLVLCQFGVMFFPDKPAAFAEAARVLRPGGTLLCTAWDVVATSDFPAALVGAIAAVVGDPPDFVERIPHGYVDEARIRADLSGGGLVPDGIDLVVLRGRAPSARTIAEGFGKGTPLAFELQHRGSAPELVDAIAQEMTRRLGSGPVESDLTARVIRAHKPGD